jgi:hypothetical protein
MFSRRMATVNIMFIRMMATTSNIRLKKFECCMGRLGTLKNKDFIA